MSYSYVDSGYDQCCENKVDVISLLVTLFAIGAEVVSITNIYTNSLVNAYKINVLPSIFMKF